MLELRPSLPEEWSLCRAFWRAQGASEETLNQFERESYVSERVIPLWDEGELRGLLVWGPTRLRWPDGGETNAACLLAVLGEGYQDILLSYAEFYLAGKAIPALTTACDLGRSGWLNGFQPGALSAETEAIVPVQRFIPAAPGEEATASGGWMKRISPVGVVLPQAENE